MKTKAYGICIYKIKKSKVKILLCKSINSANKWGFLKGAALLHENPKRCAQREFYEESNIFVPLDTFDEYFEQINDTKDIGIFLVNYDGVPNARDYFFDDILGENYLCEENSEVRFFGIDNLPQIKTKQEDIAKNIKKYLKNIIKIP